MNGRCFRLLPLVLADAFQGDNYIGPQPVLAETRRILQRGR